MSKKVNLTWKFGSETITEEVTQHDGKVETDERIPVMTSEGINTVTNSKLDKSDLVVFEDEEGIFALPPEQIIVIRPVDE